MSVSMTMECRTNGKIDSQKRSRPSDREPLQRPMTDNHPSSIDRINAILNRLQLPRDVNETRIESLVLQLDRCADDSHARYRLLTARVLEAALVCTGHYVDNCEFTAAGDLLANPRRTLVHIRGCRHPVVKKRHGNLSDQLAAHCPTQPFSVWFKCNAVLEVSKPALVPYLFQRLEQYRCFRPAYLDSIRRRMEKAADTIGFLAAGGITGWEEMYRRMQSAPAQQRSFIAANLCGFDLEDFHSLGREIDRITPTSGGSSNYLKA